MKCNLKFNNPLKLRQNETKEGFDQKMKKEKKKKKGVEIKRFIMFTHWHQLGSIKKLLSK